MVTGVGVVVMVVVVEGGLALAGGSRGDFRFGFLVCLPLLVFLTSIIRESAASNSNQPIS